MSVYFMSDVLAIIGVLAYIAAPFMKIEKNALYARLVGEVLLGLSFLYIGHIAGVVYYFLLALSYILEKQIEQNAKISLTFGVIGCLLINLLNNSAIAGNVLSISFILLFIHIQENKHMMFHSYMDCLSSFLLLYFCVTIHVWVQSIFAILLFIIAIAGLISSIKIQRAGGMQAVIQEEKEYQQKSKKKLRKH